MALLILRLNESKAKELGRNPADDTEGFHIAGNNRTCGDHGPFADCDPLAHEAVLAYPDVVSDFDRANRTPACERRGDPGYIDSVVSSYEGNRWCHENEIA